MIQAIETRYKGYRFRSRLEARWAVFWDAIGQEYQYEPQGVVVGGVPYLPDFWLPSVVPSGAAMGWGDWIEVKPREANEDESRKAFLLAHESMHCVSLVQGSPWPGEYFVTRINPRAQPPDDVTRRCDVWTYSFGPCTIEEAFAKARGARFEHGESVSVFA
jgi:hypothetical protein